VQPKPLLGVFAHPAFDHAGDRLHRRLFAADTADVGNGDFNKVAWSAEGTRLYAGVKADPVRIWDQEGRGKDVTCLWLGIPSRRSCPAAIRSQWAQQTRPSA